MGSVKEDDSEALELELAKLGSMEDDAEALELLGSVLATPEALLVVVPEVSEVSEAPEAPLLAVLLAALAALLLLAVPLLTALEVILAVFPGAPLDGSVSTVTIA